MIHKIQDLGSIGMIMHGHQEEMISLLNALMVCTYSIVSIRLFSFCFGGSKLVELVNIHIAVIEMLMIDIS